MSKIICDVCGTKYPESAEACPICGYARTAEVAQDAQAVLMDEVVYESHPKVRGGRFSRSNVRKRNKDVPEFVEEKIQESKNDEAYTDESFEEPAGEKSSTALNILLVVVILVLLMLTGYIFMTHFLPRILEINDSNPATETFVQTEAVETEAPTVPPVPCTGMQFADPAPEMPIVLEFEGQMYLLNILVQPEDTTDAILYTSSDESVVTVNEEGRITAVNEGLAVVTATCGEIKLECQVVCAFAAEATEEPTQEPTAPPTEPGVQKTVTNQFVNIRSGAGTEYEKVGEYKKGDVVTIYEEKMVGGRPWGRTDEGWICTEYVK